jgi:glycolate oxidase FAD binding subunit
MQPVEPADARELAEALAEAASRKHRILLRGASSKDAMGGPVAPADVCISTRRLNRLLAYDPDDLTISVEAGMPYAEFSRLLAEHGQMAPLDPPFAQQGTIGGILAANLSGPRRRLYGSARDMLIGMKFATLEGKIVESGGMVVKNAAGLDLGRLMIGAFGTLAAIVSANFRVFPIPPAWRTFLRSFPALEQAIAERDRVLRSVLSPAVLDLLNPEAARRTDRQGYVLALEAGGSPAVLDRYQRELPGWAPLDEAEAAAFWTAVREFTPAYLEEHPEGAVVRLTTTLTGVHARTGWRVTPHGSARRQRRALGALPRLRSGADLGPADGAARLLRGDRIRSAGAQSATGNVARAGPGFLPDAAAQRSLRSASFAQPGQALWPSLNELRKPHRSRPSALTWTAAFTAASA